MKLLLLLMFVLAGCTKPATLDLQINSEADSLYEEACAHYENEEIDSCTYKPVSYTHLTLPTKLEV